VYGLLFIWSISEIELLPNSGVVLPKNFSMLFISWYSDMSILIIFLSSPKNSSHTTLLICVLPTPVGPMKRNVPMGLFGSLISVLARLRASTMVRIASSCPTTLLLMFSSSFIRFVLSSADIGVIFIFFCREIAFATCSEVSNFIWLA